MKHPSPPWRIALPLTLVGSLTLLGVACGKTSSPDDGMGGAGGGDTNSGGLGGGGLGGDTSGGGSGGSGSGSEATGSGGTLGTCGNGLRDPGEQCDQEGDSATCNRDCTTAQCGDEFVNEAAGEECDDGGESERCNLDCTWSVCGDSIVNAAANEVCDGGEETAECDDDCTFSDCGDGITNEADGEQCDQGGDTDECDDDCTFVDCGDDYVNAEAGEECEGEVDYEGTVLTINYCVECKQNTCGDDLRFEVISSEEVGGICANETDCSELYAMAEDCDSGGVDSATCNFDCTYADCGDGHWNAASFEDCDDGNTDDDDSCSNECVSQ
jgi:cysteine-rich repeat protein